MRFTLDGETMTTDGTETIWQAARRAGIAIPHLCHLEREGYEPAGNCRTCLVEIAGERALAASCVRRPSEGMVVMTASERVLRTRRVVFELLLADQPLPWRDCSSPLALQSAGLGLTASRFPAAADLPAPDATHPAIMVQLSACIACGLCQRACRDVQHNDVIGLAGRGHGVRVVFDDGRPLGASSCVGCGECVQACPTGALMPRAVLTDGTRHATPERRVATVCPYCGVGCQVEATAQAGRIVEVRGRDGPANRGRLCVKGRFGFDYAAHPDRLARPLIRLPRAAKDPDDCLDPERARAKFREASWEEALDRAAEGFRAIRQSLGGDALAGFGSAKGSNEEAYLFQKLIRTGFGTNNVDHCTRLCHSASVAALLESIGSAAVTAPFTEVAQADVILVVGANPAENHPVAATFIKEAAARGARLIVADPRATPLDRYAAECLRFTPGRDVALLNAMLHVVIGEGLWDRDFVADRTEGFAALAEHVRRFTPEAMAPLCGVAAERIRAAARAFARARAAMILWGMGVSQSVHGTDNARALIALALLCGQVGKPGAGLHPLRGQNNVQGASDAGLIPMALPDYRPVQDAAARSVFERAWGTPLPATPGLTVVEILEAAASGRVRGLYVMGENPAMSDPDVRHAREALASLDHLVVQDLFLTETAVFADVVLPTSSWWEKEGTVTNTNRQVQIGRAVLAPPGEARPDLWIIVEMARRLGLAWPHRDPAQVFAEMQALMPSLAGITWERLCREGAVTYPLEAPDGKGRGVLFADRFATAGGRARLVPSALSDPAELPDDRFPLVLITGRRLAHWHTGTMTRRSEVLRRLEPGPVLGLAATDMRRLGLGEGERVRLISRHGAIELPVRTEPGLQPHTAFLPFAFREAAANLLTGAALDPRAKIPDFKHCPVRIERIPAAERAHA